MNNTKHMMAVVAAVAALASSGAQAVNMATYGGTDVDFTLDLDLVGLFGTPVVSGNALNFAPASPASFESVSSGGAGYILVKQTINITVTAHSGFEVAAVSLQEGGAYTLTGTDAFVEATGQIRVFDLDDPANNEVTNNFVSTLGQTWAASAQAAIPGAGWGGNDGLVSAVNLTLQNILVAGTSELGSFASIKKDFAGITVGVSPVPEADAYAMMLTGLGMIGLMVGRRRNSLNV